MCSFTESTKWIEINWSVWMNERKKAACHALILTASWFAKSSSAHTLNYCILYFMCECEWKKELIICAWPQWDIWIKLADFAVFLYGNHDDVRMRVHVHGACNAKNLFSNTICNNAIGYSRKMICQNNVHQPFFPWYLSFSSTSICNTW